MASPEWPSSIAKATLILAFLFFLFCQACYCQRELRTAGWADAAQEAGAPLPAPHTRPRRSLQQQQQQQQPAAQPPAGAGAAGVQPPAAAPRVWAYVGLAAHFPGAEVQLQHWLTHYIDLLGVEPATTLVSINNAKAAPKRASSPSPAAAASSSTSAAPAATPSSTSSSASASSYASADSALVAAARRRRARRRLGGGDGALAIMQEMLDGRRIGYTVWEQEYSDCAHYGVLTAMFHAAGVGPHDWLVFTDSDEFHHYPAAGPAGSAEQQGAQGPPGRVAPFLARLDAEGYNYVLGSFLDRVSASGALGPVRSDVPLPLQFPLRCRVVAGLTQGYVGKVMAAKGYWRTYAGFHYLIADRSQWAPRLDSCTSFNITPYAAWPECYEQGVPNRPGQPCGEGKFEPRPYPTHLDVHHYKWHAGVIASARRRLEHYRSLGLPWWRESERLLRHLAAHNNGLDLAALNCTR